MSSSSAVSIIASLNNASLQINRYLGTFIFVFGMMGNITNIFVLSQRALRSNSCGWLFFVAAIANNFPIINGLMIRILSTWSADLSTTNQFLCKFRMFLLYDGLTVGAWLIALATVDRWLSSHIDVNRRHLSTLKNSKRGTILIIILSSIFEAQHLYCFEADLTYTPLKCYTKTILCSIVNDLSFSLVTILSPSIIMLVFGLMTISNVRKVQARIYPKTGFTKNEQGEVSATGTVGTSTGRKKVDRHLLFMLLIQVFLILLLTLPVAIVKIYTTITWYTPKAALQSVIESFVFNMCLFLLYISCGMSFYVYTLSGGSVFRKAVYGLFKDLRQKLCRRCR